MSYSYSYGSSPNHTELVYTFVIIIEKVLQKLSFPEFPRDFDFSYCSQVRVWWLSASCLTGWEEDSHSQTIEFVRKSETLKLPFTFCLKINIPPPTVGRSTFLVLMLLTSSKTWLTQVMISRSRGRPTVPGWHWLRGTARPI